MMCDECGANPAVIRLLTHVDGNLTERNLCAQCVARLGRRTRLNPQALLSALMGANGRANALRCPACGMMYSDFLANRRLGCPDCYQAFRKNLTPWLQGYHGIARHRGGIPARAGAEARRICRLDALRRALSEAVDREDFEQAAELRDEIQTLCAQGKGEGCHD